MLVSKKKSLMFAGLLLAVILAIFSIPFQRNLVLTSQGQVLEMVDIGKEDFFEVIFRHSVNKGLVIEKYYILEDNNFFLKTGLFESYGAGMLDIVPDDVTMSDEGNFLRLDFPERKLESVAYAAAGIADHVLRVGDEEFHLFEENPYKRITISVENKNLFQKLWFKLNKK